MDDFDLSALSGISSEQSSGFLGEDSGLFQRNDNKNNDSDHEQDNANTYAKNKLKEETKTAEDNTNVLKPTELIKEQDKSKEKIDPVTQHNNDSPSSLLEVEKREVPIVPETKDSIAENQIKITICPSENKRKPKSENLKHPSIKKAESDKPKVDSSNLNCEDKRQMHVGKSVIDQNKNEDLGVIITLFDCIFCVSNQKVVIKKFLNDSLQKRTNKCIVPGYNFDEHYLVYYLLINSVIKPMENEIAPIREKILSS